MIKREKFVLIDLKLKNIETSFKQINKDYCYCVCRAVYEPVTLSKYKNQSCNQLVQSDLDSQNLRKNSYR